MKNLPLTCLMMCAIYTEQKLFGEHQIVLALRASTVAADARAVPVFRVFFARKTELNFRFENF